MTETNAVRLEEIKNTVKKARDYLDENKNDGDFNYPKHDELVLYLFDNKHVDWLIEQAELLQLERQGATLANKINSAYIKEVIDENKRYREALRISMDYVQNGRNPRANKLYQYFQSVLEEVE